jgi:hypothetical protein
MSIRGIQGLLTQTFNAESLNLWGQSKMTMLAVQIKDFPARAEAESMKPRAISFALLLTMRI